MLLKLDEKGLIPVICQDDDTGCVLMLGYMNPGSFARTMQSGQVWLYSRSRDALWHKGETSGNYMRVRSAHLDCDGDTLLLRVAPDGPACHTGNKSCFFSPIEGEPQAEYHDRGPGILQELFSVIQERRVDPSPESYTNELFRGGVARIAQKVIEEAGETALAAAQGNVEHVTKEIADLVYHVMVLLADVGLKPEDVWTELRARRR